MSPAHSLRLAADAVWPITRANILLSEIYGNIFVFDAMYILLYDYKS